MVVQVLLNARFLIYMVILLPEGSVFPVFELPGVGGVEPPYLTLPTPPPLVKIRPGEVEFQPPT